MRAPRISAITTTSLLSLALVLPAGRTIAQQRPGIQPVVNPPDDCYLTEPVETESLYAFTRMQLQALWMARVGELANPEVLNAPGDLPMDRTARMIAGLRQERIENTCSSFVLDAYSRSANKSVAAAAQVLSLSYKTLADMDDQMLLIIMQSNFDQERNDTRSRLAQWKDKRRGILGSMGEAVNYSLSMLIDGSHTDPGGQPDRMLLTKSQRDSLLDYLSSKFPALATEKEAAHTGDFVKQALLIRSFLLGKYKPADK